MYDYVVDCVYVLCFFSLMRMLVFVYGVFDILVEWCFAELKAFALFCPSLSLWLERRVEG